LLARIVNLDASLFFTITPTRGNVSRKDAKTQRLGGVRVVELEPKGAVGYARFLGVEAEIEDDLTECFLSFASLRLGVRSFFGVFA
jgi:hypothetical protein